MYHMYVCTGRRLFEEDNPLEIALEASVSNRNSKLILRDNTYSTIQWDAFTPPELNNFILILRREEELYVNKVGVWVCGWVDGCVLYRGGTRISPPGLVSPPPPMYVRERGEVLCGLNSLGSRPSPFCAHN